VSVVFNKDVRFSPMTLDLPTIYAVVLALFASIAAMAVVCAVVWIIIFTWVRW